VAFIASYALASVVHIYLEQPIMQLRKKAPVPTKDLMPVRVAA
jgi:peptidoglycan/LPS O-acetylase OafA/YrhL